MTIAKWICKSCHKKIYTDNLDQPKCQCGESEKVAFVWVDFEPNKRTWDEVRANGFDLKRKTISKKDVWVFTANVYATDEESEEDLLKKLPF